MKAVYMRATSVCTTWTVLRICRCGATHQSNISIILIEKFDLPHGQTTQNQVNSSFHATGQSSKTNDTIAGPSYGQLEDRVSGVGSCSILEVSALAFFGCDPFTFHQGNYYPYHSKRMDVDSDQKYDSSYQRTMSMSRPIQRVELRIIFPA